VGALSIILIILAYFIGHGALNEFWYGFYTYNSEYLNVIPRIKGIMNSLSVLYYFLRTQNTLFMIAILFSILFYFIKNELQGKKEDGNIRVIISALFLLSSISYFIGGAGFFHYLIPSILVFSMTISYVLSNFKIDKKTLDKVICVGLFITMLSYCSHSYRFSLIRLEFVPLKIKIVQKHLFEVCEYINNKTTKNDTIYTIGGASTIIHFIANRKAPTKYQSYIFLESSRSKVFPREKNKILSKIFIIIHLNI
jgi:hypothetical protein